MRVVELRRKKEELSATALGVRCRDDEFSGPCFSQPLELKPAQPLVASHSAFSAEMLHGLWPYPHSKDSPSGWRP